MKMLLLSFIITLSSSAFAKTNYNITRGKLHRGGTIDVTSAQKGSLAHMEIKFSVNPKRFIPGFVKKYLSGNHVEKLPADFLYENAYLDLERTKTLELKDAYIYHQGRVNFGRYTNSHKVLIKAKNGKSEIVALYHPIIGDAGWVNIDLTILKVPVLGKYNIKATVVD